MGSHVQALASLFLGESLRALSRNKLRSALAALGITIAIAAVVCVVAIGRAGSEKAEEQLQNLGNNLVWVEAGSRNVNGVRTGSRGTTSLTFEDLEAIRDEVPLIQSISPNVDGRVLVAYGNRNWTTLFRGVSPEYLGIKRWTLAEGASFTAEHDAQAANVCLIGRTVREQIFGTADAVGQMLRIQGQLFEVIGVLAPKGQTATGYDQDDTIMMPFTTAQKKIRGKGYEWLDDILCSAVSPEAVNPAIEKITWLMRQRHHIHPDEGDDFNIRRPDEVIKAQIEASRSLAFFLISIASISLLVGGIGIMNVMLVSVTQRTREIGLRLALGARQGHVQMQFLGEAVMLSLFGGLVGVLLGVISSFILGSVLGWPMSIPSEALLIAPAFAIGVGISFGFYPAWRAARLDPIIALRYE